MDSATLDLHLQRLREIVFDEQKIVTCLSVAADLKLPLQDAKSVLETFAKDSKDTQSNISCTYIICGVLRDSGSLGVQLVKESNLKEQKSLFETVSSEFVYSIQNNTEIDFNAIALSEPPPGSWDGLVISSTCVKRNIVKKVLPMVSTKLSNDKIKNEPVEKQNSVKSKQSHGMANFFSKMTPKTTKPGEQKITVIKEEKVVETKKNVIIKESSSETSKAIDIEMKDVGKIKETPKTEAKKRKKVNKNDQPNKKRKRIQELHDSDSDDIFGEEENNDIIERSDEEPAVVPVKRELSPPPKNKKRKAVDKTYEDEEGFLVTTTEYVYETASEDEKAVPKVATPPVKKVLTEKKTEETNKTTNTKGKNSKKAVTGKQPSIMNFFKKT